MNKDNISSYWIEKIENLGLEPIYFFTLLIILATISYYKDIDNWETLSFNQKFRIATAIYASVVSFIISIALAFC
jgi:hypothetical protein